jgi:hypothetical protein
LQDSVDLGLTLPKILVQKLAFVHSTCVKTQKRPHVVPSKLDRVSDEVDLHGKGVISLEASQILDSPQLILTSTIAFF